MIKSVFFVSPFLFYILKKKVFSRVGTVRFYRYVIQSQALDIAEINAFRGQDSSVHEYFGKSPIDKISDIILHTVSDETNYRILGLSSRIAQLAIIDAIYSYLVCRLENANERIAQTELSLKPKKM